MSRPVRLAAFAAAVLFGCAARSKAPVAATAPASRNCAANVAAIESTPSRLALVVENKSESARSGTIRELRLLFTLARCPLSVESPVGWSGSIEARPPKHYCEVAWVTTGDSGILAGDRKAGFVVRFRPGKKETPSWAVFLDACAVGGPAGSKIR